jgi:hypothetical protein
MPTMDVAVRRISVVSQRPFEEIVRRLTATIGRPDMNAFHNAVAAATTVAELESVVHEAIGGSDLRSSCASTPAMCCAKSEADKGPRCFVWLSGIRSS